MEPHVFWSGYGSNFVRSVQFKTRMKEEGENDLIPTFPAVDVDILGYNAHQLQPAWSKARIVVSCKTKGIHVGEGFCMP